MWAQAKCLKSIWNRIGPNLLVIVYCVCKTPVCPWYFRILKGEYKTFTRCLISWIATTLMWRNLQSDEKFIFSSLILTQRESKMFVCKHEHELLAGSRFVLTVLYALAWISTPYSCTLIMGIIEVYWNINLQSIPSGLYGFLAQEDTFFPNQNNA